MLMGNLQKVHLSSGQPDQKDNNMSCLPYSTALGHQMSLLGGTSDLGTCDCKCQGDLTSVNVKLT